MMLFGQQSSQTSRPLGPGAAKPCAIETGRFNGALGLLRGRGLGHCGRTRRLACQAVARPFQQGPASSSEQRGELLSHAVATAVGEVAPAQAEHHHHQQQQAAVFQEPLSVEQQLEELEGLLEVLGGTDSYELKGELLMSYRPVADFFLGSREGKALCGLLGALSAKERYVLLCLPAMGQEHVLALLPRGAVDLADALAQLAGALCRVEEFYDAIGGLAGYQRQCLRLIAEAQAAGRQEAPQQGAERAQQGAAGAARFLVPEGLNLADPSHAVHAAAAALAGLAALPALAEVYPLGGAGDRLGLRCEATGDSLPTAVLQYCGRTLLEALVRDLQGREYLHWRVHGTQHTTPVAIMTSAAKGNHWRVKQAFEAAGWFGRGRQSFRLFQQPLVPMVSGEDGRWLLSAPLQPLMKPGGHGVIWKLMLDSGVFQWLRGQGRQAAIVRQISNPMAGMDNTLLALAGTGYSGRHSFGFASCERAVGAAEGINVLMQHRLPATDGGEPAQYEYCVTNVEYTEFERLGFADEQAAEGSSLSKFPANTNVLYVGLQAAEGLVRNSVARGSTDAILPGMILNLKKQVSYHDAWLGRERSVAAGRLECTMQNLADCLARRTDRPLAEGAERELDTFVLYNQRRKVTSSAKRKLKPGSAKVHQTPDGSFYDLQQNARELLLRCGFEVPEVGTVPEYLAAGPGLIFLFHPALGPLWDVVAQKLRGGSLAPRSELVLEVAEACLQGVHVQGSLLVHAECVMGHLESQQHPASHLAHPVPPSSASGSARSGGGRHGHVPGGGAVRKVHNGVEHSGTEGGAFGGVLGAGAGRPAAAGVQAAASQQQQHSQHLGEPKLVYSDRCGRVRLQNVRVENRGVDWEHPDNVYWRHKVRRHESVRIVLRGRSEFEARDVTLSGDLLFEVPDGHRMSVRAGPGGEPEVEVRPLGTLPSWSWHYSVRPAHAHSGDSVLLRLVEGPADASALPGKAVAAA